MPAAETPPEDPPGREGGREARPGAVASCLGNPAVTSSLSHRDFAICRTSIFGFPTFEKSSRDSADSHISGLAVFLLGSGDDQAPGSCSRTGLIRRATDQLEPAGCLAKLVNQPARVSVSKDLKFIWLRPICSFSLKKGRLLCFSEKNEGSSIEPDKSTNQNLSLLLSFMLEFPLA